MFKIITILCISAVYVYFKLLNCMGQNVCSKFDENLLENQLKLKTINLTISPKLPGTIFFAFLTTISKYNAYFGSRKTQIVVDFLWINT